MGVTQKFTRRSVRMSNPAAKIPEVIGRHMEEAARNGEAEAKAYIDITGTGRSWDPSGFPDLKQGGGRRYGPNDGRVNTGTMRDAIEHHTTQGATTQIRVGWINHYEDYFGHQDKGFSAGGYRERVQDILPTVEGMRLMAHMRAYMRDQTDEAVNRSLREITDGI